MTANNTIVDYAIFREGLCGPYGKFVLADESEIEGYMPENPESYIGYSLADIRKARYQSLQARSGKRSAVYTRECGCSAIPREADSREFCEGDRCATSGMQSAYPTHVEGSDWCANLWLCDTCLQYDKAIEFALAMREA